MPAEVVVLLVWITFENDFPYAHTAVYRVYQDSFDSAVITGKKGGILGEEVAEKSSVTVACGFTSEVLRRIRYWVGGGVFPRVVFGNWVAGEEVGCYFRGAILGEMREELAVLFLEEGAEGWEVFAGDGIKEWVFGRHPERKVHS